MFPQFARHDVFFQFLRGAGVRVLSGDNHALYLAAYVPAEHLLNFHPVASCQRTKRNAL